MSCDCLTLLKNSIAGALHWAQSCKYEEEKPPSSNSLPKYDFGERFSRLETGNGDRREEHVRAAINTAILALEEAHRTRLSDQQVRKDGVRRYLSNFPPQARSAAEKAQRAAMSVSEFLDTSTTDLCQKASDTEQLVTKIGQEIQDALSKLDRLHLDERYDNYDSMIDTRYDSRLDFQEERRRGANRDWEYNSIHCDLAVTAAQVCDAAELLLEIAKATIASPHMTKSASKID